MKELILRILACSLSGTAAGLAVLGLKRLLKDRLSPAWHCYIWVVVMALLMIPMPSLELPQWTEPEQTETAVNVEEHIYRPVLEAEETTSFSREQEKQENMAVPSVAESVMLPEVVPEYIPESLPISKPEPDPLPEAARPETAETAPEEPAVLEPEREPQAPAIPEQLWQALAVIWLGGAALFFGKRIGGYNQFAGQLYTHSHPGTKAQERQLHQACRELGIRRNIELRVTILTDTPMIVGLIRPQLYLPEQELSGDQLSLIFLHELTHYRYGDLFYKWLAMMVQGLHWFNPICERMADDIDFSCELCCDGRVKQQIGDHRRREYSVLLLELVARSCQRENPSATFSMNKGAFQRRLGLIMSSKTPSRLLAMILTLSLTISGAACSAVAAPKKQDSFWNMPLKDWDYYLIYDKTDQGQYENRAGVNFQVEKAHTPILAAADGTVAATGMIAQNSSNSTAAQGLYVILSHEGGYTSEYYACDEVTVQKGDNVKAGDAIATTGEEQWPEFRFEVRQDSKPVQVGDVFPQLLVKDGEKLPKELKTLLSPVPSQPEPFSVGTLDYGHGRYGNHYQFEEETVFRAVADGEVLTSENLLPGDYDHAMEIAHENGMVTRYLFDGTPTVEDGATVKAGQVIAKVNRKNEEFNSYRCHYEVLSNGKYLEQLEQLTGWANPVKKWDYCYIVNYTDSKTEKKYPGINFQVHEEGTPILAVNDGVVNKVAASPQNEWNSNHCAGEYVVISHDGGYQSVYYCCDEVTVKEGDVVKVGDPVALTADPRENRFRLEITKDGEPVDVRAFYGHLIPPEGEVTPEEKGSLVSPIPKTPEPVSVGEFDYDNGFYQTFYQYDEPFEIRAAADGAVMGTDWTLGLCENMIQLSHGGMVTRYAFDGRAMIKPGDAVKAGDVIAKVDKRSEYYQTYVFNFQTIVDGQYKDPEEMFGAKAVTSFAFPLAISEGKSQTVGFEAFNGHTGEDYTAPKGTPVLAAEDGVVTQAGYDGALGNTITIDHGDNVSTRYAMLDEISVEAGQRVKVGQFIGTVGNTGNSTGSHLHFETIVYGKNVDPATFGRRESQPYLAFPLDCEKDQVIMKTKSKKTLFASIPEGTQILAPADGVVLPDNYATHTPGMKTFQLPSGADYEGWDVDRIEIDHGNGYTTVYSFRGDVMVEPGGTLKAGQPIGIAGTTEEQIMEFTLELKKNGEPMNPEAYMN